MCFHFRTTLLSPALNEVLRWILMRILGQIYSIGITKCLWPERPQFDYIKLNNRRKSAIELLVEFPRISSIALQWRASVMAALSMKIYGMRVPAVGIPINLSSQN